MIRGRNLLSPQYQIYLFILQGLARFSVLLHILDFLRFLIVFLFSTLINPDLNTPFVLSFAAVAHRVRARLAGTEAERYVEFVYGAIERTRDRQIVPSRAELQAIMDLDEVTAMVYCHGGGSCQISISSHITAGEVGSGKLCSSRDMGPEHRWL